MKLNNFLQAHGALNSLTWIESASGIYQCLIKRLEVRIIKAPVLGPAHGPEWTITAVSVFGHYVRWCFVLTTFHSSVGHILVHIL
jgi:hypothetical protein